MLSQMIMIARNKKLQEKLFIIIFSIYTLSSLETITMFEQIAILSLVFKVLRYLTYVFFLWFAFVFLLNLRTYDLKNNIRLSQIIKNLSEELIQRPIIIIAIVISFCVLIVSKNRLPLIVTLILIGSSQFNFKNIIKYTLMINVLLTFITIICSELKFIPEIIIAREDGTLRYSLGFVYPLELMCNYLFIIMMYIYDHSQSFSFKDVVVINIINILLFKLTDARTSFILIMLISMVAYFFNKIDINHFFNFIKKWALCFFALVCSFGSIALSWFYSDSNLLLVYINNLLSGRLLLGHQGLNEFGLSLFGKQIEWVGFGAQTDLNYASQNYNFVDCSYTKNLLDFGVIFFILIIIGYIYILISLYNQKNIMGIIVICFILIVSIVEPRLFQIEMNPFLILMGSGLTKKISFREEIKHEI